MPDQPHPRDVVDVVAFQADACSRSGSPLYGAILDGVVEDLRAGGTCAELLADRGDDPFGSALALRLLGAVHRVVLEGRAPALAEFYPSVGGGRGPDGVVPAFLDAVRQNLDEVSRRTDDGVQTNEVGRSAVLAGGYAMVAQETGLPLRALEVGASAGLNLRWDRYAYDVGGRLVGDPTSPVCFTGIWRGPTPPLPDAFDVVERRGCDRNPIDATTEDGARALLSYVWPDQLERVERLRAAIEVARHVPVPVDRATAPDWVEAQLADPRPGVATVVSHSIVMQYLSPTLGSGCAARCTRPGGARPPTRPWPGCAWSRLATGPSCASPPGRGARGGCWPPPASTAGRCGGRPSDTPSARVPLGP